MNRKYSLIGTVVLLMSSSGVWADEHETTIRLMGAADAELPAAVMKEISLPDANAMRGLEMANDRIRRREAGLLKADAAREDVAEMADGAAENRQNDGRGDRPDPQNRPEPQGPPGDA